MKKDDFWILNEIANFSYKELLESAIKSSEMSDYIVYKNDCLNIWFFWMKQLSMNVSWIASMNDLQKIFKLALFSQLNVYIKKWSALSLYTQDDFITWNIIHDFILIENQSEITIKAKEKRRKDAFLVIKNTSR